MKSDMQLHQDVLAELAWDPRIGRQEIGLAVKEGVVTLTGTVTSYAQKWAAERAAERIIGVRAVANDLTVNLPDGVAQSDTAIAHRVLDSFAWDIEVPERDIKVAVTNGWITLEGQVEWQFQRDAAARAVRNLSGVRGVSNNLTVKPHSVSAYDVSREIKQALERRADRTADKITVDADGGIVTLRGSVPSFGERRAAEGAAWSAPGVSNVRDELFVAP
jgi:osmotically-inducible protein OsmY